MRTDHHETLSTPGTAMRTSTPELRFALHQARERTPSHDDRDVVTEHLIAMANVMASRDHPRLVILSPQGGIDRANVDQKDRRGSTTQSWIEK